MTRRYVVTGATGFVGTGLRFHLPPTFETLAFGADDWRERMAACDLRDAVVMHLAARAHFRGHADAALLERDNVEKTRELARHAARCGAARIVFLSSVKVLGEETTTHPFRRDDPAHPRDAYARSKWAAEGALREVAQETGLGVTVVRPPLVYGRNAKANLGALLRLADSRWSLPFGAIANRRSFVHVDDLARLLIACAEAPQAAGRVYLAAHPDAVSTPQVVATMRAALGRPSRLVRVPPAVLEVAAAFVGQGDAMRRLTRSLEIDASDAANELGWTAEIGLHAAIDDMVAAYRATEAP